MAPHQHNLTTPAEILQTAFGKEMQSRDFYAGLAASCAVDFVRELLEKLQNEEARHMRMVQAMRSRLESGKDIVCR